MDEKDREIARLKTIVDALRNVERTVYGTDERGHHYPMVEHRRAWDALWTAFYDYEERPRPHDGATGGDEG